MSSSSEEDEDASSGSDNEEENSSSNDNSSDEEEEDNNSDSDDDSADDEDKPKEEPLPPLPKFTRRKREPPNPDIPWISAIPMSNELDELKTRIKQIEFYRDEEVSAMEEQLELAQERKQLKARKR